MGWRRVAQWIRFSEMEYFFNCYTVAATAALRIKKRSAVPLRNAARNGGSGRESKTESRTTFNGHGAARLVAISIIIAARTSASHLQYGRMSSKANDKTLTVILT